MENNSVRLFSIIFAVSVVVGSWLLFEYSQRPDPSKSPAAHKSDAAPDPYPMEQKLPAPRTQTFSVDDRGDLVATYHCRGASGTVYRDHPCAKGEREQKVTFAARTQVSADEIDDLKAKAASMAQARIASDRKYQAEQQQISAQRANARAVCDDIDRQVETIDAQLRQPNPYTWIDTLNERRRKLMNFRFSSGC